MTNPNVFNRATLPKIIAGTTGWALPAPGAQVVACVPPCDCDFPLPVSWGGSTAPVKAGVGWITGLAVDDTYPNVEQWSYIRGLTVDASYDDRAAAIYAYFKVLGHEVELFLAEKKMPAIVLGVAVESGQIETKEGLVAFSAGDILMESPVNVGWMWRLLPKDFSKKYDKAGIRQGQIPADLMAEIQANSSAQLETATA